MTSCHSVTAVLLNVLAQLSTMLARNRFNGCSHNDKGCEADAMGGRAGISYSRHARPVTLTPAVEAAKTKTPMKSDLALLRAFLVFALPVGATFAQQRAADQPPAPLDEKEEPLQLSPFVVIGDDRGYLATNSISATRTNTPIKELPINVQVVTRDFLDDINANYFLPTAMQWQAAVGNAGIRGFGTNANVNGRAEAETDFVSFGRVELLKGPAAIITGSTLPGGMINAVTKKPTFHNGFRFRQTFGPNDYRRTEGEINTTFADGKVGLLLAHAYTVDGAWDTIFDDLGSERAASFGVLEFRPRAGTTIRIEGHQWHEYWDATRTPGDWENIGRVPIDLDDPAAGSAYILEAPFNFPRNFNIVDDGAHDERVYHKLQVDLEQKLTDNLDLSLTYYGRKKTRHVEVPTYRGMTVVDGQRMIRTTWNWWDFPNPWSDSYDAKLLWKFDAGPAKHKLMTGFSYGESNSKPFTQTARNPDNTVQEFLYPFAADTRFIKPLGIRYTGAPQAPNGTEERTIYAVHTANWFNGKLFTLAGVFDYDYERWSGVNKTVTAESGDTSPSVGVVYQVRPSIGVYAAYSKSLAGTATTNSFGETLLPYGGENSEVGVKVDYMDGRISATISAYENTFFNRETYDPNRPNAFGTLGDSVSSGEDLARGFDIDAVVSWTPNWQTLISFAHNDTHVVKDPFDALEPSVGLRSAAQVANAYALWTKYRFVDGPFSGLSVGGGIRGNDGELRYYSVVNNVRVPSEDNTEPYAELFLSWRGKIMGVQTYANLNVKNLTKQELYRGYDPSTTVPIYAFETSVDYFFTFGVEF